MQIGITMGGHSLNRSGDRMFSTKFFTQNLCLFALTLCLIACNGEFEVSPDMNDGDLSSQAPPESYLVIERFTINNSEFSSDSIEIRLSELGGDAIVGVVASERVASVLFHSSGQSEIDSSRPFEVRLPAIAGEFQVEAIPFGKSGAKGPSGLDRTLHIRIINDLTPEPTPTPTPVPTPVPTPAEMEASIGLHFTATELAEWRSRMTQGPYRVKNDVSPNSPDDWLKIAANAQNFLTDPDADRYNLKLGESGPLQNHIKLRDAAFYYLLTGNKTFANAVRQELIGQIRMPNVQPEVWGYPGDVNDSWFYCEWMMRLLYAYDYTMDVYSAAERSEIEDWFYRTARHIEENNHRNLAKNFPNRRRGDYNTKINEAASFRSSYYTYLRENGTVANQISHLAHYYNNRRSTMALYHGLVGVLLEDDFLIEEGKRYVREMLMFSTYPDGSMGEYQRNGDYGRPNAGVTYSAINIETAVVLADALARRGDFELYEYKTSAGLWGTEGGEKSIKLLIDTYINIQNGQYKWYYSSVSEENRIDWYAASTYFIHELWFLPMANLYYQDSKMKEAYMHPGPGSNGYPTGKIGTAGPSGPVWGGSGAKVPGILFMNGQMEELSPFRK